LAPNIGTQNDNLQHIRNWADTNHANTWLFPICRIAGVYHAFTWIQHRTSQISSVRQRKREAPRVAACRGGRNIRRFRSRRWLDEKFDSFGSSVGQNSRRSAGELPECLHFPVFHFSAWIFCGAFVVRRKSGSSATL